MTRLAVAKLGAPAWRANVPGYDFRCPGCGVQVWVPPAERATFVHGDNGCTICAMLIRLPGRTFVREVGSRYFTEVDPWVSSGG